MLVGESFHRSHRRFCLCMLVTGKSRRGRLRGVERSAGQKTSARSESTALTCDVDRGELLLSKFTCIYLTLANVEEDAFSQLLHLLTTEYKRVNSRVSIQCTMSRRRRVAHALCPSTWEPQVNDQHLAFVGARYTKPFTQEVQALRAIFGHSNES